MSFIFYCLKLSLIELKIKDILKYQIFGFNPALVRIDIQLFSIDSWWIIAAFLNRRLASITGKQLSHCVILFSDKTIISQQRVSEHVFTETYS